MTGYRIDATELGDARRRVEELVAALPGDGAAFEHPWELRAFAIAVAAHHEGHYGWSEFQLSLVEAIQRGEAGEGDEPWSYYEHWLTALETVLAGNGVLSESVLDASTRDLLAAPRGVDHQDRHHSARREPVAIDPAR